MSAAGTFACVMLLGCRDNIIKFKNFVFQHHCMHWEYSLLIDNNVFKLMLLLMQFFPLEII